MSIDLLKDWLPGPKGGYLTGSHDLITRIYPTRLVWIKSFKSRFPTDVFAIRNGNLTFWQTENGESGGWTDPKAFKLNVNYQPILCPLAIDALSWTFAASTPTMQAFVNAQWDGVYHSLGSVTTYIPGTISINWGGDVGQKDTLLIVYSWGADREIYSLVKGFGLVGWQHAKLANGVYVTDNVSVFNKFVPCAQLPDPVFGFPNSWLP